MINKLLVKDFIILSIGYLIISIIILTSISSSDFAWRLVGVFGMYTYFLFMLFFIAEPEEANEKEKQGGVKDET